MTGASPDGQFFKPPGVTVLFVQADTPGGVEPVRFIAPTMVSNHRVELHALRRSLAGAGPLDLRGLRLRLVGEGVGGVVFPGMLERGEADAGFGGLSILVREPDLRFIGAGLTGPVGLQRGDLPEGSHQLLLVRRGSPARSIEDLHGGAIGLNGLKPVSVCALKLLLSRVWGFELAHDFRFVVDRDYASLVDRLRHGGLDAVLTYENFTAALLRGGEFRAVFDVAREWRRAFGRDLASTVGFAARRFAGARPADCAAVSALVGESVAHADAHLEATCAAVAAQARAAGEPGFSDAGLLADVYRRWAHQPLDEDARRGILDYLWGCYELGLLAEEPREAQVFIGAVP